MSSCQPAGRPALPSSCRCFHLFTSCREASLRLDTALLVCGPFDWASRCSKLRPWPAMVLVPEIPDAPLEHLCLGRWCMWWSLLRRRFKRPELHPAYWAPLTNPSTSVRCQLATTYRRSQPTGNLKGRFQGWRAPWHPCMPGHPLPRRVPSGVWGPALPVLFQLNSPRIARPRCRLRVLPGDGLLRAYMLRQRVEALPVQGSLMAERGRKARPKASTCPVLRDGPRCLLCPGMAFSDSALTVRNIGFPFRLLLLVSTRGRSLST